ncbi:MAG: hypothetical protein KatS3mg126_1614 [Lysobacteraceae bacterium]|nr:MAG: hypothetical protein KatS3mg126_1614 [Xanthomonadaceae bacterium]
MLRPEEGAEPIGEAVQPEALLREALATGQAGRIEACLRLPGLDPELAWQAVLELDRGGHHEAVARALQGMAVEALEARGRLVEALQQGRLELARRLLERGVSPGGLRLAALLTPASMAGAEAEALLRRCLAEGADGWAWHGRGSALHAAVRCGWVALADDLLARGVDPGAVDACGWTPLHHAAWRGEAGLVALLLRAGARLDRRTVDGRTALGLALRLGDAEVVDWLDWQGWKPPGRPLRELDLIEAAALGDADAVERLLAMGLAVSAQDAQGCTALLRASGGGHLDCVASLLEHGADPSIPARTGATCLSAAITQDRRAVVEYLLDHGADPDQRLPGGVTALMVAAALGLPDMLRVLLARGADPGCVDDDGNHALHALAHWGFSARERGRALDGWQLLLRADPEAIDRPRKDGLTPLLLLLGARSDPGHPVDESCLSAQLEVLLERGVDLGRCDARGMGPLHLCAQHGLLSVLRRLLRAGADRNLRDTLGRTPLDIAVQRGFVDLAVELGPEDGSRPLSMARFLRDR